MIKMVNFFIFLCILTFSACSTEKKVELNSHQKSFMSQLDIRIKKDQFDKIQDSSQKWKYISTEQLQDLITNKDDHLLIDARNTIEYRDSHIPGAISIPASKIPETDKLPKELDFLLIFYCNGPKCTKSKKAAIKAIARGYTNILVYDEGIPEWRKRGLNTEGEHFPSVAIPIITPTELEQQKSNAFLIDLRDEDEYNKSTIEGTALNAPLDKIDNMINQIPANKEIIIFDHVGKQTLIGGRLLYKYGISNVKRLSGGWVEWLKLKKDK